MGRHPGEYLLVRKTGAGRRESLLNNTGLFRLHPDIKVPEGYELVTYLRGGFCVYHNGRLLPKFWALKRVTV